MPSSFEKLIKNIIIRKIEIAVQGSVDPLPPSIENEIKNPEFENKIDNWSDVDSNEINIMCDDAVKILQYCTRHKNDDASNYVTSLIKKLNEKLTTSFDVNNQPERFHWTEVSKSITRLLAIYISLSNYEDNEKVKRDICHHLINKIIPPLNPCLPWSYKSSDTIISLTLPRVYSNFMYDENKLKEEVKDRIFVLIAKQYKNLDDNQELRDNFEYYDFYNNLHNSYKSAIKDERLLEYRKIYEDESVTITY
ncbi:uncharacterized protein LOC130677079 [Microplitis mediator]|uniref:uncharacterized protein LOC130677079 n=1 Tax=Microplitis mediator TaxID=375433 RepID=UPI002552748F|nr:uncharacterized protein LOC130677079 [Microplitis mediator]